MSTPKISELTGPRVKVTDPHHLIDMGRTHGLLSALEALEAAKKETPVTGIGVAIYVLKALEAENRVRVMQQNIRLVAKAGIDLEAHDVYWNGSDEIIAEPRLQDGEVGKHG